jgi:hypothetical protein
MFIKRLTMIVAAAACVLPVAAGAQLVEGTTSDLRNRLERVPKKADDGGDLARRLEAIEEALKRLGSTAAAPAAPAPQSYTVEAGKSLEDVLKGWSGRAGYDLAFEAKNFIFPLSGTLDANFDKALNQLQLYLCQAEADVQFRVYENRVLRVFDHPCPTGQ